MGVWDQEMTGGISSMKIGSFLLGNSLEKTTDALDCVAHDVEGGGDGEEDMIAAQVVTDGLWTERHVVDTGSELESSLSVVIDLISSSSLTGLIFTFGAVIVVMTS